MTRIAGLKPCATGAPFVAQPFRAARKADQPFTAAAILLASSQLAQHEMPEGLR